MYGTLAQAGLTTVGMNTDCFYVEGKVKALIERHPDWFDHSKSFDSIGRWKVEYKKFCPQNPITKTENELRIKIVPVQRPTVTTFDEEQTWDQPNNKFISQCCKQLKASNTLIDGLYPGTGKSYLAKQFVKRKSYVMVVPFNTHCESMQADGWETVTVHNCLALA
jgi:hypothetical protein